jgi:hypothetical protein
MIAELTRIYPRRLFCTRCREAIPVSAGSSVWKINSNAERRMPPTRLRSDVDCAAKKACTRCAILGSSMGNADAKL